MHIKPSDRDAASAGAFQSVRQLKEPSSLRKVRLMGGATRVPSSKETSESPFRVFVSAIGQSISARTPLKKSSTSTSASRNEAAPSTPASTRRMANNTTVSSQTPVKHSTMPRVAIMSSTSRSSVSSTTNSSSSVSSSTPIRKQSSSVTSSQTPVSKKSTASSSFGSSARSSNNPTTPIGRKSSAMPPRTPTGAARSQNDPTTPVSNYSSIPTTGKKQGVLSTPRSKQATTPSIQRKQANPTTPVARQTSVYPTTPVNGYSNARTPLNTHSSNIPFCTPKTTIPGKSSLPSPLQPRNTNVPSESSRRLHFGINLSAMAEQENMGLCTPRASNSTVDATYSFDKERLAQIKARRNAFQKLLASPAQRVSVSDYTQPAVTPRRPQVVDETSDPAGDHGSTDAAVSHSPMRRRVANSLF